MKAESDQQIQQDQRRNPIKRAQRQKQFRTVGQLKQIFTNPEDIYKCVQQYTKSFKSVKNIHPFNKDLQIIDFSLAARGPQQDQIYVTQPFYRNNIRRGNTIVYNNKTKQINWGRKGLMKFFDISQKSVYAIKNQNTLGLNQQYNYIHQVIFLEIQNILSCNDELPEQHKAKIHVYRLNKANGQNAQVSYYAQTKQWVISSKNVSIFIKQLADIKAYEGQRYQFAILIAKAWFTIIQNIKKQQLNQLKQQMDGKTFVGQYCGNPDYQHLVKYSQITIYFYAVVENTSIYTCLPPPEAFRIFQKYKIPIVKNHENSLHGKFTNYVQLGTNLTQLFKKVACSSIFQDQQGSVLYFLAEKPKQFCQYISDRYLQSSVPIPKNWEQRPIWFNVCSLGKLKTLQYRLLRKLREKLKYFTRLKNKQQKNENDQKKLQQKYGSFQRQVYKLVKNQQLSKPLEYYFCAAIVAFQYTFKNRKNQRNLSLLSDHYLDFISVIFWSIQNKKQVVPAMMNDQELHKQLRGTTWQKYSIQIIDKYPQMLARLAPRYAKIKKSMKQQDLQNQDEKGEQDD